MPASEGRCWEAAEVDFTILESPPIHRMNRKIAGSQLSIRVNKPVFALPFPAGNHT
jgi:hypothetical protein